jgi:heme-degrading monooxygenase HmoA
MYLHLELKRVPAARQQEAIERLNLLHSLMHASPGFIDAQIAHDIADPAFYVVLRRWRDAAAHAGYRASDASKAFGKQRPEGLYENLLVQEWECAHPTPGTAASPLVARTVYAASQPPTEATVPATETFTALSGSPAGETLRLAGFPDRTAAEAYQRATTPAALTVSCYEVVARTG